MFSDKSAMKSNIFERSWIKFIQAEFVMDYLDKDWSNIVNIKNVNVSMNRFVNNLNKIYLINMPNKKKKKISNYKLKSQIKL